MRAIHDIESGQGTNRVLLGMLPGVGGRPEDFVEQGFVRAVRERGLAVDVVAVDARMDYYIDHSVVGRLAADVIVPAREKGYSRIWLMGISLGGMGSIACAREHPEAVEGVILLAPFLGSRGLIAEVVGTGGLDRWRPGDIAQDDEERGLLAWLKQYRPDDPGLPGVFLGYGTDDRFAASSRLLSERLPAGRVATVGGGHDWPTWRRLWNHLLDQDPFSTCTRTEPDRRRAVGIESGTA